MLNTNAISGTLVKSTKHSKFLQCQIDSPLIKLVFKFGKISYGLSAPTITILQVMSCGDGWLIIEYIYDNDIEEEVTNE